MKRDEIATWEAEQAAIQMAIVRREDEAFNRLSPEVRARINKQRADEQEAFAIAALAATKDDADSQQ
jgi:hypothetical protein